LSFKSDTDDLRGSPMVAVAETFLGRGYQVRIYDPQLNLSLLTGANEAEINQRMPHLASLLMSDLAEVTETSDTLVVAQRCVSIPQLEALVKAEHHLVDVNHWPELQSLGCVYEGFCW
jgi:GDP-mannose 6-dehydrogenase